MSRVRGIPTSRAYWELKAEQVLNRVFEPEPPLVVEICDTPRLAAEASPAPSHEPDPSTTRHAQGRINELGRQPKLVLAGAGITVMVMAGVTLVALGSWYQSQQAIRQERNMLLIERLRAMGPNTQEASDSPDQAGAPKPSPAESNLPPPPPGSGEPWMEELATLPASSAPAAEVLKVPISGRITSPAPAATGSSSSAGPAGNVGSGGGTPQLVGVVQVPGQSGSAIFQLGGSSTSAAVGDSIGSSGWRLRSASGDDVAPGNRSTVNESPHPARLGRGLHHETNPPHSRADHPQAQDR